METETWIERTIIDQLTTHDRRYKHDYGDVEKTTDDLVAACAKLDTITAEGRTELPSIEQLLTAEADIEPEVETVLQTLQERGLIDCVGERDRLGPPLEPGDYGTTAVWQPTIGGRAEVRALREAYTAEVETLVESRDDESDEFSAELILLAKTYGVLPDYFG
jgi:hypothetical protein